MNDLDWAELVLHVLAHLAATAHLPSSVHDPSYVEASRRQLGPVQARALGQDLVVLGSRLVAHEVLSQVQLLTRLHPSLDCALRASSLELHALTDSASADLTIRDQLLSTCAIPAELLRCAALLEAEVFARWPLPDLELVQQRIEGSIADFWLIAPRLRRSRVRPLRVLGYRGRGFHDEIWIGIPDQDRGPSLVHVLCQAAHEATVLEVGERALHDQVSLTEREVEHVAVALLARRARGSPLLSVHREWLRLWDPETASWASGDELPGALRGWLERLVHTPFGLDPLERRP